MARKIHFYLGFGIIRDHLFKRLELSMDRGKCVPNEIRQI